VRLMVPLAPAGGPTSQAAAAFPDAILVTHRAAALTEFEVWVATAEDMAVIHQLVGALPEGPKLMEQVALAVGAV